jgi:CheY-like chemotaxis protein/HPt (histidine-containing phosphotransfer) domain-containing protein
LALHHLLQAHKATDPFPIALIDMQMPGMDGVMLGRTIKTDKRLAATRLVMLSSLGMRGAARRMAEIGFDAYLTNPFQPQELCDILSLVLAERGGDEPAAMLTRHAVRELPRLFIGSRARLLLAEDNITNQQVALGILKKLGLRADAVANGAEAVNALTTLPYDLVLMDIQMPVMDGLEATRQIRDLRSAVLNHAIPIIAMTAHAMQGDREKCLKAGIDDYVSKPVTPLTLAKALEKWLPPELDDRALAMAAPELMVAMKTPTAEPAIWDREEMLTRLMDDQELLQRILEEFLADIPQQLKTLHTFLAADNIAGVARQAHTLKGAFANVSAERLRALAYQLEVAAKSGDLPQARTCMTELNVQFDRLKDEMVELS